MENTKRKLTEHLAKEDHLHIRGEYNMFQSYADEILGSPPHTWTMILNHRSSQLRITSTYVENTKHKSNLQRIMADHLHIRGEY